MGEGLAGWLWVFTPQQPKGGVKVLLNELEWYFGMPVLSLFVSYGELVIFSLLFVPFVAFFGSKAAFLAYMEIKDFQLRTSLFKSRFW